MAVVSQAVSDDVAREAHGDLLQNSSFVLLNPWVKMGFLAGFEVRMDFHQDILRKRLVAASESKPVEQRMGLGTRPRMSYSEDSHHGFVGVRVRTQGGSRVEAACQGGPREDSRHATPGC